MGTISSIFAIYPAEIGAQISRRVAQRHKKETSQAVSSGSIIVVSQHILATDAK